MPIEIKNLLVRPFVSRLASRSVRQSVVRSVGQSYSDTLIMTFNNCITRYSNILNTQTKKVHRVSNTWEGVGKLLEN